MAGCGEFSRPAQAQALAQGNVTGIAHARHPALLSLSVLKYWAKAIIWAIDMILTLP
jgi:hypothetical protein